VRIIVKVKPGAKENSVSALGEKEYSVRTKALPKDDKANKAVIDILAEYFDIQKRCIRILKGHTGRIKILEIS